MEKEILKNILDFLEEEGEHNMPFKFKLIFNEPLTKEDFNVKGYLNLMHSKITSLPEGLKVGGFLSLGFTNIASLPEGLKVGGDLNLYKCIKLTSLPEGLKVGGILDLRKTNITSLPKGLEVHSNLVIINTALLEYTDKELRDMVKPGFIKGEIIR